MIAHQIAAFALLSTSGLLGQTEAPTPDTAPTESAAAEEEKAAPSEEEAKSEEKTEGESEDQAEEASEEEASEEEASPESTKAEPEESSKEAEQAALAEEEADEAASAEVAPAEPAPEEAQESSEPPRINPLASTDEHNLGKHPVEPEASHYKPGTGLVFKSKDGDFSMAPRLRIQFRDEVEIGDEETTHVFGIRRARLQFKGHVFGKNNKYKAEFAFSPRDLSMKDGVPHRTPLLSWYTEHTQLRDLSLRVGQYKLLYSRQRVVSSGNQEFVDRTIAQGEFNLDRDIGFHFFSKDLFGLNLFKYYTGFTIAEGRDAWDTEIINSDGTSASWQYLGRVEVLPFGDFKDYSEVDFKRLNNVRLSVGAAYAHTENVSRDRGYQGATFTDGGTVDYENVTVDALMKWAGWTAFAEFYYRNGQRGSAALSASEATEDDVYLARDGIGGSFQLGYLLPGLPVGLGARYSSLGRGGFSEEETSVVDEHEAGGTVGWYIAGHPLKLQADYFHIWSDEAETQSDRFRVQLQVAY